MNSDFEFILSIIEKEIVNTENKKNGAFNDNDEQTRIYFEGRYDGLMFALSKFKGVIK